MQLAHDDEGFLTGDPVEIDSGSFSQALDIWRDIKGDTAAIRASLGRKAADVARASNAPMLAPVIQLPKRSTGGVTPQQMEKIVRVAASGAAKAQRPAAADRSMGVDAQKPRIVDRVERKAAAVPKRDATGRFVRSGGKPEKDGGESSVLSRAAETMSGSVDRLSSAIAETEQIDPAIAAAKEIGDVVGPVAGTVKDVGKGVFGLFKKGDEKDKAIPWYRRIWGELRSINKKGGGDGGGLLSMLLGPLAGLVGTFLALPGKIVGLMVSALSKIGLMKAAGGLAGGFGDAVGGAGGGSGKGAAGKAGKAVPKKGFFGKLGGLAKGTGALAALGAGLSIMDTESDDTLTREQKNNAHVKTAAGGVGGWAGTVAGAKLGAVIGTFIAPGIGTAVGGFLGGVAGGIAGWLGGEKLGDWVNELRASDIPGQVVAAWDTAVSGLGSAYDFIKDSWSGFVDSAKSGMETAWEVFGVVFDVLKKLPVIGPALMLMEKVAKETAEAAAEAAASLKEKAGKAKDIAVAVGGKAVEKGREVAQAAGEKAGAVASGAKEAAGKAWEGTKSAAVAVKDWALGKTSQVFESGKGGAGTVSSGKGDYGGASYGTYQLSSTQGTLGKFLKQSGYESQFAGLKPGTPEFNAKWKEVAATDPTFGGKQHEFIKATHYDPQMKKLADGGIDLSKRGAAVQDAVWSTSVQFGGNSSLIQKALAGKDTSKMSDAEIVSAIQDYKIANNDKLFAKSSSAVRKSTLARAEKEKGSLLALAETPAKGVGTAVPAAASASNATPATNTLVAAAAPGASPVAAAPVPAKVPTASPNLAMMTPPPAPAAPPQKIGSNGDGAASPNVTIQPDVGQNVSDRGIAQVVTGGIGGYTMRT